MNVNVKAIQVYEEKFSLSRSLSFDLNRKYLNKTFLKPHPFNSLAKLQISEKRFFVIIQVCVQQKLYIGGEDFGNI